jgi:hypothetical protein
MSQMILDVPHLSHRIIHRRDSLSIALNVLAGSTAAKNL